MSTGVARKGAELKGIVITGGRAPAVGRLQQITGSDDVYVVAADSGYDTAVTLGFHPDLVIGDLDSITRTVPGHIPVHSYPSDKDQTDTQLAVAKLRERGCSFDFLLGGGEGRLDHLYALLELYVTDYFPDIWITEREMLYAVYPGSHREFPTERNQTVSLLNPCRQCTPITSEGLQWELKHYDLQFGSASISNRSVGKGCSVANHGQAVIIVAILFSLN